MIASRSLRTLTVLLMALGGRKLRKPEEAA